MANKLPIAEILRKSFDESTNVFKTNAVLTGDVQIGAVEIKNDSDDTRAKIGSGVAANALRVTVASDQPAILTVPGDSSKATYSAAITSLVLAAAATDIFTITGSGTKTIKIKRLQISGTATTAGAFDFQIIKRSTANTAGTSTNPTAVPHDSNDVAATALINAYTANPTLGTAVGIMKSIKATVTTSAGAIPSISTVLEFGQHSGEAPTLRGTTQVLAVNFNAATAAGGSLNIDIEWTEE